MTGMKRTRKSFKVASCYLAAVDIPSVAASSEITSISSRPASPPNSHDHDNMYNKASTSKSRSPASTHKSNKQSVTSTPSRSGSLGSAKTPPYSSSKTAITQSTMESTPDQSCYRRDTSTSWTPSRDNGYVRSRGFFPATALIPQQKHDGDDTDGSSLTETSLEKEKKSPLRDLEESSYEASSRPSTPELSFEDQLTSSMQAINDNLKAALECQKSPSRDNTSWKSPGRKDHHTNGHFGKVPGTKLSERANTSRKDQLTGPSEASWVKKKSSERRFGSHKINAILSMPALEEKRGTFSSRQGSEAGAPTEVMSNLRGPQHSDTASEVMGAPTEIITNRESDVSSRYAREQQNMRTMDTASDIMGAPTEIMTNCQKDGPNSLYGHGHRIVGAADEDENDGNDYLPYLVRAPQHQWCTNSFASSDKASVGKMSGSSPVSLLEDTASSEANSEGAQIDTERLDAASPVLLPPYIRSAQSKMQLPSKHQPGDMSPASSGLFSGISSGYDSELRSIMSPDSQRSQDELPIGRLGRHVYQQKPLISPLLKASNDCFQDKSVTSSIGVETGWTLGGTDPIKKPSWNSQGRSNAVGIVDLGNINDQKMPKSMNRLDPLPADSPHRVSQAIPPIHSQMHSKEHPLLIPVSTNRPAPISPGKVSSTASINPFAVSYSQESKEQSHGEFPSKIISPHSPTSSGWTPVAFSSSGVGSDLFVAAAESIPVRIKGENKSISNPRSEENVQEHKAPKPSNPHWQNLPSSYIRHNNHDRTIAQKANREVVPDNAISIDAKVRDPSVHAFRDNSTKQGQLFTSVKTPHERLTRVLGHGHDRQKLQDERKHANQSETSGQRVMEKAQPLPRRDDAKSQSEILESTHSSVQERVRALNVNSRESGVPMPNHSVEESNMRNLRSTMFSKMHKGGSRSDLRHIKPTNLTAAFEHSATHIEKQNTDGHEQGKERSSNINSDRQVNDLTAQQVPMKISNKPALATAFLASTFSGRISPHTQKLLASPLEENTAAETQQYRLRSTGQVLLRARAENKIFDTERDNGEIQHGDDENASIDVNSIRSFFENNTHDDIDDDDSLSLDVQSIRSIFEESKAEPKKKKAESFAKARSMFEQSQKTSGNCKSFSGNISIKDAFSKFEAVSKRSSFLNTGDHSQSNTLPAITAPAEGDIVDSSFDSLVSKGQPDSCRPHLGEKKRSQVAHMTSVADRTRAFDRRPSILQQNLSLQQNLKVSQEEEKLLFVSTPSLSQMQSDQPVAKTPSVEGILHNTPERAMPVATRANLFSGENQRSFEGSQGHSEDHAGTFPSVRSQLSKEVDTSYRRTRKAAGSELTKKQTELLQVHSVKQPNQSVHLSIGDRIRALSSATNQNKLYESSMASQEVTLIKPRCATVVLPVAREALQSERGILDDTMSKSQGTLSTKLTEPGRMGISPMPVEYPNPDQVQGQVGTSVGSPQQSQMRNIDYTAGYDQRIPNHEATVPVKGSVAAAAVLRSTRSLTNSHLSPISKGDNGSRTDSEFDDGVTLEMSIAEISALTNPTCLLSKEDLNSVSTGDDSSDQTSVEVKGNVATETEGRVLSEASSSQLSEAAVPLIARMKFFRSDDTSVFETPKAANATNGRNASRSVAAQKKKWDTTPVTPGADAKKITPIPLRKVKSCNDGAWGIRRIEPSLDHPSSEWHQFASNKDSWFEWIPAQVDDFVSLEGANDQSVRPLSSKQSKNPIMHLESSAAEIYSPDNGGTTMSRSPPSTRQIFNRTHPSARTILTTPPVFHGSVGDTRSCIPKSALHSFKSTDQSEERIFSHDRTHITLPPIQLHWSSARAAMMLRLRTLKEARMQRNAAALKTKGVKVIATQRSSLVQTSNIMGRNLSLSPTPKQWNVARRVVTPNGKTVEVIPRHTFSEMYAADDDFSASVNFEDCLELD